MCVVTIVYVLVCVCLFFFFQAEDGIRDWSVTGVQTCALPICSIGDDGGGVREALERLAVDEWGRHAGDEVFGELQALSGPLAEDSADRLDLAAEIGRASCRERV